jgi:hypothetical protein
MPNDLKKLTTDRVIYTVEDMDEFVHYATSSPSDLARHIREHIDRYNREQHIVCEYPSTRSLIPTKVRTVKGFIAEFSIKDTWKLTKLIRSLIS